MTEFPFRENPRLGVITTITVLEGAASVLLVSHDADDGGWQFLCGTTDDPKDSRIVCLADLVDRDRTLAEVADLPLGWVAFRTAVGGEWTREPA